MKKLFYKLLVTLIIVLFSANNVPVYAKTTSIEPLQIMEIEAKSLDKRARILRDYLAQYNSPLQNHAQDFVDAADTHQIDWKLVPAIAGVESTFGKFTPGSYNNPSFNGWGWGVYGTQAIYFKSWKDAIYTISEGLKKNYIDKGLTDPYKMNRIYAASKAWGGNVDYFLKDIEKFAKNYSDEEKNSLLVNYSNQESKTAGSSGKLALK